ncbi:hypothetical protein RP20_CCG003504 [Aedes albopictus]|nr:hypothetical protein RP20_CCG003504 [Aedes albopictus]
MYASLTSRPDLAATANYFSQFQACPTDEHWVHLRRVLRYVKGTLDLGLIYRGDADETLLAVYTDADWANDIVDRRSVSGAVFKVFGASVCWFARKQPTVSLSSTEAELVALCGAACHSQWLVRVLCDLGWSSKEPVRFYEDNQSTIKIVSNPKDSGRLKHIDGNISTFESFWREAASRSTTFLRRCSKQIFSLKVYQLRPSGIFEPT